MSSSSSIVGHLLQREQLAKDLETKNVSHAYLLAGPSNIGKMTVAKEFAQTLLTEGLEGEKKEIALNGIARLTHSDLLILDQLWIEGECDDWDVIAKSSNVPQAHRAKKPGAKTNSISIDDVRALQERLFDTGTGIYRVCIIRSVERMQDAAANAFLKILEEPPEGLVFLLTTEKSGALLPTIRSRTRVMNFRRLGTKELSGLLENLDQEDRQFILHIARGAPGIAASLRDDPDVLRAHRVIHRTAQSFWESASLRERLQILQPVHKRGKESDELLLHLGLTLREQGASMKTKNVREFSRLHQGLQTNAHRQLLAQRFALGVST